MIESFSGENRFLSNFYSAEVEYEGILYPTTEHAYQAAKSLHNGDRYVIAEAPNPGAAKKMGQKLDLRPDWEHAKDEVMYEVCFAKFSEHEDLKEKLLATGEQKLVESNHWGDVYWGVYNGKGKNRLGEILMQIRQELRLA